MNFQDFFDFVFHMENHLETLAIMPLWLVYGFFFAIIFIETAVVVMPFLPGDSFLFVIGTFVAINNAQAGNADIVSVCLLLISAAVLGDTINYHIGQYIGVRAFSFNDSRFFNKKALFAAHDFYARHGGKTIIIARFMPFMRTFAPFVAGMGEMAYLRFLMFNIVGALLWVLSFVLAGYYFGQVAWVQRHFTKLIIVIIVLSLLPLGIAYLRKRSASYQTGTK